MSKMRINWKLVLVLMIGILVVGITTYTLHKWNKSKNAISSLEKGNEAYEKGNWTEAAELLGRYLSSVQDDAEILKKYAEAQLNIQPLNAGNIKQALSAYRQILRIDKAKIDNDDIRKEAVISLMQIYLQYNNPGEAELIARNNTDLKDSPIQRLLAIALSNQHKYTEAADELKDIIQEDPSYVPAYINLAYIVEQRPNEFLTSSESWLNKAVQNNPSSAEALIARGAFYYRQNSLEKALTDYEQAETKDLSDNKTRLNLAKNYIIMNAPEKALVHLEHVYENDPSSLELWNVWSLLALKSGIKEQVLQTVENALSNLPENSFTFLPLAAEMYIVGGEFEKAVECIDTLKKQEVSSSAVAYLEGTLAKYKGQWHQAAKSFREAIQLGRKSEDTQLELAEALNRAGDRQSAIRQIQILVDSNNNSFKGHLTLARLLLENGNNKLAAEHARIASRLNSSNSESISIFIRARMQLLSKEKTASENQWKEIEDLLDKLDTDGGNALSVKLLKFQAAMQQKKIENAKELAYELKELYPENLLANLAEIDFLILANETDYIEEKLLDITQKFPDSVMAVKYLTAYLVLHNKYEQSETIINQAIEKANNPIDKRELSLLLIDIYSRQNKLKEANQLLLSLSESFPNDISLKRRILANINEIDDKDLPQQLIEQIKQLEGEQGWQWRYEQAKYWFTGDNFVETSPQIISLLKDNLSFNPDDQASRILLAATYERSGDLQLAISSYQDALSRSPDNINLITATVSAMYKAEHFDQADEILKRVDKNLTADKQLSQLQLRRYLQQGMLTEAGNIIEDFAAKDPDNIDIQLQLALLKMQQNDYNEANNIFSELIKKNPDSIPVTAGFVDLKLREGKDIEAIQLCNDLIEKLDDRSSYIIRHRTYHRIGDIENAEKDIQKALEKEPENIQTLLLKNSFHLSTNNLNKAVDTIKTALRLDPENLQVQKQAITTFLSSNDSDLRQNGLDMIEKAIAKYPDDSGLQMYHVQMLLSQNTSPSIIKAVEILNNITQKHTKIEQAWVLLANIYTKQNDFRSAMDVIIRGLSYLPDSKPLLLAKAKVESERSPSLSIPTLKGLCEIYPEDSDIPIFLSSIYVTTGMHQQAIDLLNNKLQNCNESDSRKLRIALAITYYDKGERAKAEELFTSLKQEQPDDPYIIIAYAGVLKKHNMWTDLVTKVNDWHRNHPNDRSVYTFIIENLVNNQNPDAKKAAEEILNYIISLNPDSVDAINALAVIMHTTGRTSEAIDLYQRVLELNPEHIVAINNLAWMLCEEREQYLKALKLANNGLKISPNYTDLIDTRGMIYYRLGQFENAIKDFTQCSKLYPSNSQQIVSTYYHLGITFNKIGDKEQALKNLQQAIDLNENIGGLSPDMLNEISKIIEQL